MLYIIYQEDGPDSLAIRARVKEKRGADYTEEEIKALASVKLEKFLDPLAVRSGLLDEYRNAKSVTTLADIEPAPDLYGFDEESIYASSRGGALRSIRKLLNPILKLFFNPNPLIRVLNMQAALNGYFTRSIARVGSREALNFEVLHNVVVELTRLSIENRNLKMRVESLNTRLDFAERRARALEGVVQYKTGASAVSLTTLEPVADASLAPEDADKAGRRRRRRRGRRRGPGEGGEGMEGGEGQGADSSRGEGQATESHTHAAGNDGPDSPQS